MSYIYIQSGNDRYYLDAVFDVNYQMSGTATTYATEDGFDSTDHYSQRNDIITLNGSIGEAKFVKNTEFSTDIQEFTDAIRALKKSGKYFILRFSDYVEPMNSCLFTSLNMKQSLETGASSVEFSMTIEVIRVAKTVSLTQAPVALKEFEDSVAAESSGAGGTVGTTEVEKKKLRDSVVSNDATGFAAYLFSFLDGFLGG